MLVALAVLAGGGYLAYSYGLSALKEKLAGPADYTGSGTGQVLVQVRDGEAATAIGSTHVDQAAAVVILQNALDSERGTGVAPGELVPTR